MWQNENQYWGSGLGSISQAHLNARQAQYGSPQLSQTYFRPSSFGEALRPGSIHYVKASPSTPITTTLGRKLMNIFKRKKKCDKRDWDYRVLEKKDSKGCPYYVAEVVMDGKVKHPFTYSNGYWWKADMSLHWYTDSFLASASKVQFKCPEACKQAAVTALREARNLNHCRVLLKGTVDANTETNNC